MTPASLKATQEAIPTAPATRSARPSVVTIPACRQTSHKQASPPQSGQAQALWKARWPSTASFRATMSQASDQPPASIRRTASPMCECAPGKPEAS